MAYTGISLQRISLGALIIAAAQGKHPRHCAAEDNRGPARAEGGRVRKTTAGRVPGRDRRLGRGKCESQAPIEAVVPLMLFIMATILMIQLQSFHRLFLVFAMAPLALIGVVMAL